jgi:3-oxoacyl-[acyl-carrier-protein] synthase III
MASTAHAHRKLSRTARDPAQATIYGARMVESEQEQRARLAYEAALRALDEQRHDLEEIR